MKYMFFVLVFSFILSVNGYVFLRGWQVTPPSTYVRFIYSFIFWALTSLFIIRMVYGDTFNTATSYLISSIAFTWFIAVIYFAIALLFIDLLRVLNHFFGIFPAFVRENIYTVKYLSAIIIATSVSLVLLYGNYKFHNPKVTRLSIKVDKPMPQEGLRVVLMSDIHLSSYINGDDLRRFVDLSNSQNPHIVLIAGDIADRNLKPLLDWDAQSILRRLKSVYGVYAVSGNHEFYGGEREEIYSYLSSSGINMLLDSLVNVAGVIEIAGREDRTNFKRDSLEKILSKRDVNLPLILLDHQPYQLDQAVSNKVDIQLSGHTHNGQFWPVNKIVKSMYELPYGYMKRGDTHFYVTSGIGLWGPKFRIGTLSEIVLIEISGNGLPLN